MKSDITIYSVDREELRSGRATWLEVRRFNAEQQTTPMTIAATIIALDIANDIAGDRAIIIGVGCMNAEEFFMPIKITKGLVQKPFIKEEGQ